MSQPMGAFGSRVLLRTALAHIAALLTPMVLALCLLTAAGGRLIEAEQSRLFAALEAETKQTAMRLDEAVERAQLTAYSLWQEDSAFPLLRGGDDNGNVYRMIGRLKSVTLVNSRLIEGVGLYFDETGLLITNTGRVSPEELKARFVGPGETAPAEQLGGFTSGRLIRRADGGLTFIQTYPVTPVGEKSRAMLLVALREGVPENTRLLSAGETLPENGVLSVRIESGRLPVSYYSAMPDAPLKAYARGIQRNILLAWIFGVVLALLLALWLVKRQLDPLRRLSALARGERAALPLDPYAEVQTALLDAAQQRIELMSAKRRETETEQLRLLTAALADANANVARLAPCARAAGIADNAPVCLIRVTLTDWDAYFAADSTQRPPLAFAGETLRQLLANSGRVCSADAGDTYWFYLLPDEKQLDHWRAQTAETLENARRLLRETYGVEIRCAQSDLRWGTAGLLDAYLQVREDAPAALSSPGDADSLLCQNAARYVDEHYADADLTVARIAEALGYSVEYLSRTYKKNQGEGLLSHIHEVQIAQSKPLLARIPALTIRQVAAMVGFSSSESFIRTFKRYQGVTPGRFREESRG